MFGFRRRHLASGAAISSIVLINTAFANAHTNKLNLMIFPERLGFTALGVVVELLVTATVFPVTARSKLRRQIIDVLQELAAVVDTTIQGCLPQERQEIGKVSEGDTPDGLPRGEILERQSTGANQTKFGSDGGLPTHTVPLTMHGKTFHARIACFLGKIGTWFSPIERYSSAADESPASGLNEMRRTSVFARLSCHMAEAPSLQIKLLSSASRQLEKAAREIMQDILKIGLIHETISFEYYPFRKTKR